MRDRDLYAKLLGIETPWFVRDVEARLEEREVEVLISFSETEEATCSVCGVVCSRYDTRTRSWRHLDTMQYRTLLTADVPRVKCAEHGVKSVKVPWAEPGSRFTAMFEALVIDWLKETSTSGVARMLGMSWDEVHGVMSRAVARGLRRRKSQPLRAIGIDETSFQRRHEYVTIVYDTERTRVVEVLDGRAQEDLESFFWDTPFEDLETLESVSMDMWGPYIQATREHIPDTEQKIGFRRIAMARRSRSAARSVQGSSWQLAEHPSPSAALPSSHVSPGPIRGGEEVERAVAMPPR